MKDKNNYNNIQRRDFIKNSTSAAIGLSASSFFRPAEAKDGSILDKKFLSGNGPLPTKGLAVYKPNGTVDPIEFNRRPLGPTDIALKIHFCGICHTDVHVAKGHFGAMAPLPIVPGHEFTGIVIATGSSVSRFKVGDRIAVGTQQDSCGHCIDCSSGLEQYCEKGIFTYGSKDHDGTITKGGYADYYVVKEHFAYKIPDEIDLAHAAPLMCAGATVYSPLRHWGVGPGSKVGIVGLGGLGHLAVQMAKAMGAEVTVFTTSPEKIKDAKKFGATHVLINEDKTDFSKFSRYLDLILDTAPERFNFDRLIPTLKRDATWVRVGSGNLSEKNELNQVSLIWKRNSFAGSSTGGPRESQETLNFCAQNKIVPQIEIIPMNKQKIEAAFNSVTDKKVRYRYVIDMSKS